MRTLFLLLLCLSNLSILADEVKLHLKQNLTYISDDIKDSYAQERCKLDLYLPQQPGFPCIVWFHGGGITAGSKDSVETQKIGLHFASKGIGFIAVNYRLSPKAHYPSYVEDTAAALAWSIKNIAQYGGDPKRIFPAGHSAGAYLIALVGTDPQYLQKHQLNPKDFPGFIPIAGQMMTHFTVRVERGLNKDAIIADTAAPIYHVQNTDIPPMFLVLAEKEWPARIEENQYFAAAMKVAKHPHTYWQIFKNRDHGSIGHALSQSDDPAAAAILRFIQNPQTQP